MRTSFNYLSERLWLLLLWWWWLTVVVVVVIISFIASISMKHLLTKMKHRTRSRNLDAYLSEYLGNWNADNTYGSKMSLQQSLWSNHRGLPVHAVCIKVIGALITNFVVNNDSFLSATVVLIAEVCTTCPRQASTPITYIVSEACQRTSEDWRSYLQCYVIFCRYASLTNSYWTCT